jgi:hypothetical protein
MSYAALASNTCDFCSSPTGPGKRSYFANSQITLKVPGTDFVDGGEWVGCAECSSLIDRKEWKALMDRAKSLNPALRAAYQQGKLRGCAEFIAETWSAVFDQPKEVFL